MKMEIIKYIRQKVLSSILSWLEGMEKEEDKWVAVRTVYDPLEAQMIKDVLESGGLDVIIRSSKVTPYPVNVGRMGEVKILVRNKDIHDAELVLKKQLSNNEGS